MRSRVHAWNQNPLTTLLNTKSGRTHNALKVADKIGAMYAQTRLSVPELPTTGATTDYIHQQLCKLNSTKIYINYLNYFI